MAATLGFFTAALMAAGLFGALHYAVARRTRELGLRVALGATPQRILRMVLGDALRLAFWGVAAGLLLLGALGSLAATMLVGVSVMDARVWSAGITLVVAVVLLAAWLPARRAMCLEPMEALRAD
jgi:ABC-type antimicrobial peptide transport system permease subunit